METITTALTTMASNVATNVTTTIGGILPTLAGVMSIGIVIRQGVKWIKKLANG